ncbi:MAG: NAD-dependent dehydratase [Gammaproteobacteria bacterium RIFCSPHIGHO2_02_FULL_42_13]|nr:MAG: NAD-dependent dehydratase [Gammaproteobacteria bacterium RIFCSPHIGHO2_02_FULL_42_13]OGT71011.1 MAG: NAD-dependent dehydratase [Gammaproteobacteria bacterium RIFCSPLOWO2_02_FULL_42_9]
MSNALVTGGAGFIGSHMVDFLLENGYDVVVLDNLSNGRLENLAQHQNNDRLKFFNCDIADYESDLTPYFKDVDYVFHYAALADIVPSINDPITYHRANVDGTIRVLEVAQKAKVKKLVYAASSSCYGIPDIYPTPETVAISPQYPYALTKYLGEQYVLNWHKIYHLPVVSLRFFNVYGPRVRTNGTYGAVFGVFLAQKLAGKPFTIVGDGEQTRDFTFVTDVVRACYMAAQSDISGEVMNVGSDQTYSVNRLVDLLRGKKIYLPKRPGEPDCTFADITKIKKLLNWEAEVSFEEGVQIMLDNIEYWREAPVWEPASIEAATKEWFECLGK